MSANQESSATKRKAADNAEKTEDNKRPAAALSQEDYETPTEQQPLVGDAQITLQGQPTNSVVLTPGQKKLIELFQERHRSPPKPLGPHDPLPDLDRIQKLIDEAGYESIERGSEEYLMLVFLYVRGVPQFLNNADKRQEMFNAVLEEGSGPRERLQKIMKLGDDHGAGTDHHQSCPDSWVPKYPFDSASGLEQWNATEEAPPQQDDRRMFTIFQEMEPNQAKQCSKNCYLVAATTCHAYAVKRASGGWKKVDVSTYIRYAFDAKMLYKRIIKNKGGQAIDVFNHLSSHDQKINIMAEARDLGMKMCFELLQEHGAGLVTKFHVDDNFRTRDEKFSYDGQVTIDPEKMTGHAMVLVGVREDAVGKCWMLLQNWWEYKQFVEVSLEYFKSSQSQLYFPTQKHTDVREPLTTTHCLYTEADIDDGGDEEDDDDAIVGN